MQQRLPSLLDDPIAFGHRGARGHLPDNTIESFQLALTLGCNGLETDVWTTRDGIPVLDHDGQVPAPGRNLLRRHVPISEVDADQLPPHIPSLQQLLEVCGHRYHLSIDLKDADAGMAVIEVVRATAPDLLPRAWLCAPRWETLLPLRGMGARLVDSTRLSRISEGPERRAATLAAEGIDALNMHHSDWNGGLVALLHRFERVTFGWDMQDEFVLRPAFRMGLDGVYSDFPERMIDAYTAEIGAVRLPDPGGF